jgi:PIN domain nuclease of toxin-antitoxin system
LKLLLDSHLLLWWPINSSRLGKQARELIMAGDSDLYMSAASWWELGLKHALGKLDIDPRAARRSLEQRGVTAISVTIEHIEAAARLPLIQRDPFDHMLVAQSLSEGLLLLTRDKRLAEYGPSVLSV